MRKFKTAEEYLALDKVERASIVDGIIEQGYRVNALDYIEVNRERELYELLQNEYKRIELLAYAIGDEVKAKLDETGENDHALSEFMSGAAVECEQLYCGDYMSHEDGFWEASNC